MCGLAAAGFVNGFDVAGRGVPTEGSLLAASGLGSAGAEPFSVPVRAETDPVGPFGPG
jgi:hypothetical protein